MFGLQEFSDLESSIAPRPAWFRSTAPDEFADHILLVSRKPVFVGAVHRDFRAQVKMAALTRMGLFVVRSTGYHAAQSGPRDFVGVNIPLSGSPQLAHSDYEPGWANVLDEDEEFGVYASNYSAMLCASIQVSLLRSVARDLSGGHVDEPVATPTRLSLRTPEGSAFYRYLCFVWAELDRGTLGRQSRGAIEVVEDNLAALYLQAVGDACVSEARAETSDHRYHCRAEEYIRANENRPVSVVEVAAAAGASARSLSRAFHRRHGMSTQAYIRQRRLEAVHRALLGAEPTTAKVNTIAPEFGFYELGRFAVDYRKRFQESPSETLRR
jgi:AraC-like DNA-binding protein